MYETYHVLSHQSSQSLEVQVSQTCQRQVLWSTCLLHGYLAVVVGSGGELYTSLHESVAYVEWACIQSVI